MRRRILIPVVVAAALVAGGGVTAHAAADRQASFAAGAAGLRAQWTSDVSNGLAPASLAPLRSQLDQQAPAAGWWSPTWFADDGQALLQRLRGATDSAWTAAVTQHRGEAEAVMASWTTYATQEATWLDPGATATAARWPEQLAAATTPAAIDRLVSGWQASIATEKAAVAAAHASQRARLDGAVGSAGGPQALLAQAQRLLGIAAAANLDAGPVSDLAAALRSRLDGQGDAVAVADQLLAAVTALQALVSLNDRVAVTLQPLLWNIDQAAAESTPSAASFRAQDSAIAAQMRAARTTAQLDAVSTAATTLSAQVAAELATSQCGHPVAAGKVITINLSLQEMVFYQDGCAVKAAPVSTGRPQLRTPTGNFSIFYKQTPFRFVSPWPMGSPFYYPPTNASWVMEFAPDGYFIHDAPWEAPSAFGPGSEDVSSAASHGCVHTPSAVMEWAFSWTPKGTPVVITA